MRALTEALRDTHATLPPCHGLGTSDMYEPRPTQHPRTYGAQCRHHQVLTRVTYYIPPSISHQDTLSSARGAACQGA